MPLDQADLQVMQDYLDHICRKCDIDRQVILNPKPATSDKEQSKCTDLSEC